MIHKFVLLFGLNVLYLSLIAMENHTITEVIHERGLRLFVVGEGKEDFFCQFVAEFATKKMNTKFITYDTFLSRFNGQQPDQNQLENFFDQLFNTATHFEMKPEEVTKALPKYVNNYSVHKLIKENNELEKGRINYSSYNEHLVRELLFKALKN